MHTLDQGVDRHRQFLTGRHRHHGGIVADAQAHIVARLRGALADQFDQVEFHRLRGRRQRLNTRVGLSW